MPTDENGIKWACEPCIRGHRSTGCTHWDRYMIRVKRPGRPLSTCPHTNDSCTCLDSRVMMVKVMIDSQCYCRPDPNPDRTTEPSLTQPANLSKELTPATASGKPKQEPISPDQEIFSSSPGEKSKISKSVEQSDGIARPALLSSTAQRRSGNCCSGRGPSETFKATATANIKDEGSSPGHGSCCGQKRTSQHDTRPTFDSPGLEKQATESPLQTGTAVKRRRSSGSSFAAQRPRGGCCSSGGHSHQSIVRSIQPPREGLQKSQITQGMPHVNGSQNSFSPSANSLSSISTPGYTQYQAPSIAPGSKTSMGNGFFEPSYVDSTVFQTALSGIDYPGIQNDSSVTPFLFESDACKCGDDCDCFGCPVHPFNVAVRNELRELSVILEQDMAAHTLPTPNNEANMDFFAAQDFLETNPFYYGGDAQVSGMSSTPALQTNTLPVPEYSTLELVYQQCEGRAEVCQCEDDCTCPGCATHGIPPLSAGYNSLSALQPDLLTNDYKTTITLNPNFLGIPQSQQFYNQLQYLDETNVLNEAPSSIGSLTERQDSHTSIKPP